MTIQTLLAEAREWRRFRLDPAWVAIAVIFAVLAVIVPHQAATSAVFTAKAIWSVLPFFVLSIGLAAYAKATGAENLIARAFAGRVGNDGRVRQPHGRVVALLFMRRHSHHRGPCSPAACPLRR